ncbi:MAG: methyltransferase domain-containing protein [Planctomycetales bacterium]
MPIAGDILEESQWTQTALKKLPEGAIDFPAVFGRSGPVVLDLGCGNARFLIGSAVWRPEHLHLGVDILPLVIRYATRRGNQRGLTNVRFGVSGGRELLEQHIAPGSVREIHCYHPQPYYTPQEIPKRLITPQFLVLVHRSLEEGGEFYLQTDHPAYWKYMQQVVPVFFEFEERKQPWPDAPKGRTRREIIALRSGLSIFRGVGRPRKDLSIEEALKLAESLPVPTFNADRRLYELDRLEREGGE